MLLFNELERIVNVGDSISEYLKVSRTCESFWPLDTQDPETGRFQWHPAAHSVFLVFRDYLRRVWVSDRESLESGHLDILLGLRLSFADQPEKIHWSFQTKALNEAWAKLRETYPDIGVGARPVVAPNRGTGTFSYAPVNDFQRAIYQLFLESWRAEICPPGALSISFTMYHVDLNRPVGSWRKAGLRLVSGQESPTAGMI